MVALKLPEASTALYTRHLKPPFLTLLFLVIQTPMTSGSIFSLERETGQQDLSRFKYSPSTDGNFSPHPCNYPPQLLILWPGLLILLTKQLHHRESVGLYSSWACLDPLVFHLCQRDWDFMLLPGGRRVILNVVGCYPWVVLSLLPILLLPSYFTRNNTVLSPGAKL